MKQRIDGRRGLRPRDAAAMLGVDRNTLLRWEATRPDFPRPRRLSARCTVYVEAELVAWRDAQIHGVAR